MSELTRARVLDAVRELDYLPNKMAQGLRLGRSNTVALAVGDIEQNVYSALTKHLQIALEGLGLDLLLYNLGHSEDRLLKLLDEAAMLGVRAVLIASSDTLPEKELVARARVLADLGISVIAIAQDLSGHGIPSAVHDDEGAAYAAVCHLIRRDRLPVAYVGRIAGSVVGTTRFAGYCRALAEAGQPVVKELVWDVFYRYRAGYDAVMAACDKHLTFKGLLAGSDELAMGAVAAAHDRGVNVPRDLSVIGFGGADWGEHSRPNLSTMGSHPDLIAAHVRTIFEDLNQKKSPPMLLKIPRTMILRSST